MATREEAKLIMSGRGFTEHSRAGDGSNVDYVKQVGHGVIYARVYLHRDTCQLDGTPGLFRLSTGEFALNHPDFQELFETPLTYMLQRLGAL